MKILSDKLVSCESETVEYNSLEEFNEDKSKRRKNKWNITTTPDFYNHEMKQVIKYNGNKMIVKWIRYGGIMIG